MKGRPEAGIPSPRRVGHACRVNPARRTALAAALASLVLVLSGCVKADLAVQLRPDDVVATSLVVAMDDEFAASTGRDARDVLEDALRGRPDPAQGAVRSEDYAEGGYTGTRYHYPEVPVPAPGPGQADPGRGRDGAGAGAVPVTVVREGDEYVVDASVDLTEDALGIRGMRAADVLTVTVAVSFPGRVTDSDGVVTAGPGQGETVTWTPPVGEVSTLHARGSALDPAAVAAPPSPGPEAAGAGGPAAAGVPEWIVPVIGVGGLLILLLVGLLVWQALRVRPAPPAGPPAAYPAAHGPHPVTYPTPVHPPPGGERPPSIPPPSFPPRG